MQDIFNKIIDNKELLAESWANTDLTKLEFKKYFFYAGSEIYVYVSVAPKRQFKSLEQSFVATLKMHVFHIQDWDKGYASDLSKDMWLESFNVYLFKEHFFLKGPNFKSISGDSFMTSFVNEIEPSKELDDFIADTNNKFGNLALFMNHEINGLDYTVFGVSDEVCVFMSWAFSG